MYNVLLMMIWRLGRLVASLCNLKTASASDGPSEPHGEGHSHQVHQTPLPPTMYAVLIIFKMLMLMNLVL